MKRFSRQLFAAVLAAFSVAAHAVPPANIANTSWTLRVDGGADEVAGQPLRIRGMTAIDCFSTFGDLGEVPFRAIKQQVAQAAAGAVRAARRGCADRACAAAY